MDKKYAAIFFIFLLTAISQTKLYAQEYYVSNTGNDLNTGVSPSSPWQTISKVNSFDFKPGDVIRFKKNDAWREQLIPKSGSSTGSITYTSYGDGAKPKIYGSISKSHTADWINQGNNIWKLNDNSETMPTKITRLSRNYLWTQGSGKASCKSDSANSFRLDVNNSGKNFNEIQLIFQNLNINTNKSYSLKFKIKSSIPFLLGKIDLMENQKPWRSFCSNMSFYDNSVGSEWKQKELLFRSNNTTDKGRITFFLGETTPSNSTIHIKDMEFAELSENPISCDIGNIIFNSGKLFGNKKFALNLLQNQGDFFYDNINKALKLYSTYNPGIFYSDIELAQTQYIIDQSNKSYVVYNGLELKYGGSHGIGGGDTSNITVRNCDISYIGGGLLNYVNNKPVRFGNGIEFWGNAHDNLVEDCYIYEIYDAGLTNQSSVNGTHQHNITYRRNIVKNCEYSFEYWNLGPDSVTTNILFESNICSNAGSNWGHSQRPDPFGTHIIFYSNTANTTNIRVFNNVFDNSSKNLVHIAPVWKNIDQLSIKNNHFIYKKNATLLSNSSKSFSVEELYNYNKIENIN